MATDKGRGPSPIVELSTWSCDTAAHAPHVTAGWLSQLSLSWVGGLLRTGYSRPLQLEDVWPLAPRDEAELQMQGLEQAWTVEVARALQAGRAKPSLARAMVRLYKWELAKGGALYLTFCLANLGNPFLVSRLVRLLEEDGSDDDTTRLEGFLCALGFLVLQVVMALCQAQCDFVSVRIGINGRSALYRCIFNRSLDIRKTRRPPHGQLLNFMSMDTEMLVNFMRLFHRLWTAPFVIAAGLTYIYTIMGASVFAGFGLMCAFLPVSLRIGAKQRRLQKQKLDFADRRVQLTNEMVQGAKLIKLYAWERPLLQKVLGQRALEMRKLYIFAFFRALTAPLGITVPTLASVVAILTYAATAPPEKPLSAADAFTIVSLFTLIRGPFTMLPMCISFLAQLLTSLDRLGNFMQMQHQPSPRYDRVLEPPAKIQLHGSFAWPTSSLQKQESKLCLEDWQINVNPGELVALVGRVGAGKSASLAALLDELDQLDSGHVQLHGRCAVCTQEPFIENRSIRENITFGNVFDEDRYAAVLFGCALVDDLALLPAGDETEIGERGINISGGQRARVSLARAAYSPADIILLDDPLSAVDMHVGKHIFEECINGPLMRGRTRLFITNQLQFLSGVDRVLVLGAGGAMAATGTYTELVASSQDFRQLLESVGGGNDDDCNGAEVSNTRADTVQPRQQSQDQDAKEATRAAARRMSQSKNTIKEVRVEGVADYKVYKQYFILGARSTFGAILLFFMFVIAESSYVCVDTWLALWSSDKFEQDAGWYMRIYGSIAVGYLMLQTTRSLCMAAFAVTASGHIHDRVIKRIFRSPLAFFEGTPSGRIMNRFSKDMADIDMQLYERWEFLLMCSLRVMSILIMSTVASPTFAIAIIPLLGLYVYFREFYRRTARELQRVESISRSPVLAHFAEVLNGTDTLRCYSRLGDTAREHDRLFRENSRAFFASRVCEIWLSQRLMLMGALVVSLTAVSLNFVRIKGFSGLALAYALNIVINLQASVQNVAEVEAKMVAVERMLEYGELETEGPATCHTDSALPSNWPQLGEVNLWKVDLRYRPDLPLVLNKLSLQIRPSEKVGVVGRTGAGKSSLFVALFRVRELDGGQITIDDVDASTVGLEVLRSRLTIIPQEPVLFTGSARYNLDIFNEFTDEEIWDCVEQAKIAEFLRSGQSNGSDGRGLEMPVADRGENLSAGQRQLFCLARALLRKPRLLLLDEATASVDAESDALIQRTIRTAFSAATVITVAHRLLTVADSDRVLVLEQGAVKEFAPPLELLGNPESLFTSLVNESGSGQAELLHKLARGETTIDQMLGEDDLAGCVGDGHVADVKATLTPKSIVWM